MTRWCAMILLVVYFFFFQAEDGIRDADVTGVQTCALPILLGGQYTVVPGEATFVDEQTVRVGNAVELSAERILIATGGRTAVPPIPGIEQVDWIDHISALELDRVPASLLVIGAGAARLAVAPIFARLRSPLSNVH